VQTTVRLIVGAKLKNSCCDLLADLALRKYLYAHSYSVEEYFGVNGE
jgi:hypothetical protein